MSTTTVKHTSLASVATEKARNYMIQLCKHFGHRTEAVYDETTGHIVLKGGACRLDASREGVLTIALDATDDAQLAVLEDVVDRHLRRFAFKEELAISWVREV